jgi:hypothetical protein
MKNKTINLVWLGPDSHDLDESIRHWSVMASGHALRIHRNMDRLLPELKPVWKYAARNKQSYRVLASDLLRWSILLTEGGYYFDTDRGVSIPLESLEERYPATDKLIVHEPAYAIAATNAMYCPPGWKLKDKVLGMILDLPNRNPAMPGGSLDGPGHAALFPPWPIKFLCDNRNAFLPIHASLNLIISLRRKASRGVLSPPATLLQKAANFAASAARHIAAGAPMSSDEEVARRFAICQTCEHFDGRACRQCGCPVVREKKFLSKLSWANESCPVGKW